MADNGAPFREAFFSIDGDPLDLRLIGVYPGDGEELPYYYWRIRLHGSGEAVGAISLRLGHNRHSYFNGNVGYEIDEAYRGRHYALLACRMVAELARKHGMDRLYLSCADDNAASYRTIEALGAQLLETVVPPKDYLYYYEGIPAHRIYLLPLGIPSPPAPGETAG